MPKRSTRPQPHPAVSEMTRKAGLKGGPARMASLSPEERSILASKAGKAASAALSAKERSERARNAVRARWARTKKSST